MHRAWHIFEVSEHIVSYLPSKDLTALARVSKHLHDICIPAIWKHVHTPAAFCANLPADLSSLTDEDVVKLDSRWSLIRNIRFDASVAETAAPPTFPGETAEWTLLCRRIARSRPPRLCFTQLDSVHLEDSRMHFLLPLMGATAPRSLTLLANWKVRSKYQLAKRFVTTLHSPERLQHLHAEEDFDIPLSPFSGLESLTIKHIAFKRFREELSDFNPTMQNLVDALPTIDAAVWAPRIGLLIEEVFGAWSHSDPRWYNALKLEIAASGNHDPDAGAHIRQILDVKGWFTTSLCRWEAIKSTFVFNVRFCHLKTLSLSATPHFLFDYSPAKYAAFAAAVPSLTHLIVGLDSVLGNGDTFRSPEYTHRCPPLHHCALFCSLLPSIQSLTIFDWLDLPIFPQGTESSDLSFLDLRILRPQGYDVSQTVRCLQAHLAILFPRSDLLRAFDPNDTTNASAVLISCERAGRMRCSRTKYQRGKAVRLA